MKYLMARIVVFICMVLALILLIVSIDFPDVCKHENIGKRFYFQPENSTTSSYVETYCKGCDTNYGSGLRGYYGGSRTMFEGAITDTSYLDAIREHAHVDEIIGGEYYTISATVCSVAYGYDRNRISCVVQKELTIVYFVVDFKEPIESVDSGDVITFCGRYYDMGCWFTDCELIEKEVS